MKRFQRVGSYQSYKKKKQFWNKILYIAVLAVLVVCVYRIQTSTSAVFTRNMFNKTFDTESKTDNFSDPSNINEVLNSQDASYELHATPSVIKGVYFPSKRMKDYKKFIQQIKDTDVNSVVIDVKRDNGTLSFYTDNKDLQDKGVIPDEPAIENIDELMAELYMNGIYPIARVVAFKDNKVPIKEPERAVKDAEGNVYKTANGDTWLDPYNRDNWDYILEICDEAIDVGFKEIQFDYVRFHESMKDGKIQVQDGKTKTEIIVEFTKYAAEHLHAKGINVSADVFGTVVISDIDAEIVGQDFVEMSKYLDYISPMIYPSHYGNGTFGIPYPHTEPYTVINKTLSIGENKLANLGDIKHAELRPWMQDFTISSQEPYTAYDARKIRLQIQGANDAGVNEWLFWNAAGNYTTDGLK